MPGGLAMLGSGLRFGIFDLRFAIEDFESEMPVGIELYGKIYQFRAYL
jgi:hypothetical protein